MTIPVPPIFVVEGWDDVYVYETVEEAALSLEPWWVEQSEGAVYDSEGRLLELGIDTHNVLISVSEETPRHSSNLRSILLSFLSAVGEEVENDSDSSLAALVTLCTKRANTST
jgi:hypothetical protein